MFNDTTKTVTPIQPFNVTNNTINFRNEKIITFFILYCCDNKLSLNWGRNKQQNVIKFHISCCLWFDHLDYTDESLKTFQNEVSEFAPSFKY